MKRFVLVLALALVCAGVASAEDAAWFDMENCAMCVNIADVVQHAKWENHVLGNGMLSITIVEAEHVGAWADAREKMGAVTQKLMSGEQLPLCNFCQSMGGMMMAGASMESVNSDIANAEMMLITSDKPEVVTMIKAHANRTIKEYNKMVAAEGDTK